MKLWTSSYYFWFLLFSKEKISSHQHWYIGEYFHTLYSFWFGFYLPVSGCHSQYIFVFTDENLCSYAETVSWAGSAHRQHREVNKGSHFSWILGFCLTWFLSFALWVCSQDAMAPLSSPGPPNLTVPDVVIPVSQWYMSILSYK
jgi:hypothetical protein